MKKYLLSLITLTLLFCEATFTGGGMAFATPVSLGNGVTWEISGTTLTIGYEGEGSGVMPDYANVTDRPWDDAKGDITSIIIENGVTSIGKYAFKDFTAITALNDLPSSVTILGYQSFNGCTSLTSVTIPQNVTKTGDGLFGGCSSLTTVVWNAENCTTSLKSDGSDIALSASWNPFYGTPPRSTITSFTFGSNVEVIPAGLCSSMTNITSITIPSSVVTIGNDAFKGCSKITTITIPSSVTSIGTSAFQSCSVLANITIPQGVTTISNYTFDGCAALVGITIPSSVTSIGNYAFRNCSTLVRVNFPSALTSIGTSAFENTPKLKSIPLASATSLTSIGSSAFALSAADATATGLLVIPSSVTSIGGNAFKNRSGLTGVVICNTSTSTWTNCSASTTFTGTPTDIPVYVYSSTCSTHYQSATGWDHFASAGYTTSYTISSMDCGTTASTLYASLNLRTGSLTFSGSKCNMKNYNNSNNKAPWAAYKEAIKSVTFNSYVQTVGEYAFYECGALATVNTGSATNLTSIGQRAFQYCRALTSITIPASVTSMSAYSFYDTGLTSVTWNATNCTSITNASATTNPFANVNFVDYNKHPEKLTSFTFGSEVEVIPAYLCYGLTGITSITIPSKVTSIGGSAFAYCSALSSVIIQRTSTMNVANGAFGTCNALSSVKYAGTADQWCGITFGNSTSNPTYFSRALKLNNSDEVATSVSITASSIGKYAFERNEAITSVTMSSAVQNFGTSAFDDCTNLTSMRFNGSLAQWCDNSFANNEANPLYYAHHFYLNSATELTELEIPEAITSIADNAFYNGTGFESISVYSTTSWGANTFTGCVTPTILGDVIGTCGDNLTWRLNGNTLYIEDEGDMYDYADKTSMPWYVYRGQIQHVEISDEATSIGNNAFNSLTNIQTVDFGDGVTTIGQNAFYGCSGLTDTLTLGGSVETIGNEAFENCTALTSVILNDGIEELDYKAFYGCSNLLSVTVPTSLDTCGGYVFSSCGKIAAAYYQGSVDQWCGIKFNTSTSNPANNSIAKLYVDGNTETYPTSATITASTIGAYAFYDNRELTSVVITSATSIGYDAFHGCNNLARLEVQTTTPPATASGNTMLFFGVDKTIPFYIPAAGASAYADADRWGDFEDNRYLYGECGASGDNLTFVFEESTGTLTISGTGAMANYATASAMPWNSFKTSITSLVIEDGVTTIGNRAFYGCTALASVTFPETFTSFGDYVFYNCTGLTSIALPKGITSTGSSLFYGCTSLASVTLPSTLTSIGSSAFHSNAFTSISIPASVTTINSYAFKNCANLESISLPNITILNEETFSGCSKLESITLPNTLTSIKKNAFINCSKLASITIPEYVTEIVCVQGSGSATCPFSGCTSLTSVVWNARACGGFSRVGQYQEYAMPFESIKENIESFTFGANVTSIPSYVCHGMTGLTSIAIPASVTSIGNEAFDGCTDIDEIIAYPETMPTMGTSVWNNVPADATVTVYCPATETAYKENANWSRFTGTWEYVYGACDEELDADTDMSTLAAAGYRGDLTVKDGTLTMDDISALDVEINNLTVLPGARIELADGASYTIDNLILQRSGTSSTDEVATASIQGSLTAENLILDFELDDSRWFAISLPKTIAANSVTDAESGTALTPDEDYYALYFDGEARADDGYSATGSHWKWVTSGNLNAGQGYLIGLPDESRTKTLRFTMADYTFDETADKNVAVSEYASWDATNAGWNLVGNPYLQAYHHSTSSMDVGDKTLTAMVTMSISGANISYNTPMVEEAIIPPFSAVFVQAPVDGSLEFEATSARKNARARYAENKESEYRFLDIKLTGNGGSDHTSFIVGNYSDDYSIGADMVKWFNDAYATQAAPTLYSFKWDHKEAVNARSEQRLSDIPLGYHATQAGVYTFALSGDYPAFEHIWLYDQEQSTVTDLKMIDYEFYTEAGTQDARFTITAELPATGQGGATDITGNEGMSNESLNSKFIRNNRLFIRKGDKLYTVTGQETK